MYTSKYKAQTPVHAMRTQLRVVSTHGNLCPAPLTRALKCYSRSRWHTLPHGFSELCAWQLRPSKGKHLTPTHKRAIFFSFFLSLSQHCKTSVYTNIFFINWIMKSPQSLFMETVTLFTSRLGGSNIKAQQSQPNIYTCNQPTVISFTFASSTPCKHSSPLPRQP